MEEKVHPDLKAMFSVLPAAPLTPETLEMVRSTLNEMTLANPKQHDAVSTIDRFIPGPPGNPEVRVRIYEPVSKHEKMPGLLWIHGGGYIIGIPEMDDALCQRFALEAECIVVSVDYRLAPETPFPGPVEDCYAALKWFAEHADELGVDASRIAVAGASAGGGLTAAVSLLARERKGPDISFQMPLYPMIDDRIITKSSHEISDERVWNKEKNIHGWSAYLGSSYGGQVSPFAAPARAESLEDLPPTYTCVGDLDPFRDETLEYVTKLAQAGVPTEFHLYPGCFHGFDMLVPDAGISQHAAAQYVDAVKRAFQK
ncbi:acetyl esterase/lipase [Planomicrobium soli]|uniref:Acetyl esterase/lipase n=2 Tax=Planomicrobium soli TaxID=1176648 RepID=A0A2P8H601_9BACL|nr:alpha/beta hydrolase [Planomicrobium soli]PSL41665.1 acetyl esterase/lipase [Planomicrobium soli]